MNPDEVNQVQGNVGNTITNTIQSLSHRNEADNVILIQARQRISEISGRIFSANAKYKDVCSREDKIHSSLQNRRFDLGMALAKGRAVLESCRKLEVDLETGRQQLDHGRRELSKEADQILSASLEFARVWNCTEKGKKFRKDLEVMILKEIGNKKLLLEGELKGFLERERIYESALREKTECESIAEKENKLLSAKLQELDAKIQFAKRDVEELTRKGEDKRKSFSLEKERLEGRVKQAISSIERMQSRNLSRNVSNQLEGLPLNLNSHVDLDSTYCYSSAVASTSSLANSNLEHLSFHSLQGPPEKYRRLDLPNQRNEVSATGNGGSMTLVPVPTQSRQAKFLFKKKPASSAGQATE